MAKHNLKTFGIHTARFSKYVWSLFNITHERFNFFGFFLNEKTKMRYAKFRF